MDENMSTTVFEGKIVDGNEKIRQFQQKSHAPLLKRERENAIIEVSFQ